MVGFRNIAVHEYIRLNLDVAHAIITKQLDEFRAFSSTIVKAWKSTLTPAPIPRRHQQEGLEKCPGLVNASHAPSRSATT